MDTARGHSLRGSELTSWGKAGGQLCVVRSGLPWGPCAMLPVLEVGLCAPGLRLVGAVPPAPRAVPGQQVRGYHGPRSCWRFRCVEGVGGGQEGPHHVSITHHVGDLVKNTQINFPLLPHRLSTRPGTG